MVSAATCAEWASSFAAASDALFFWLRNDGIAIAARMPMIRITTSSSISVNPRSFLVLRVSHCIIPFSFRSPPEGVEGRTLARSTGQPRQGRGERRWVQREISPHLGAHVPTVHPHGAIGRQLTPRPPRPLL